MGINFAVHIGRRLLEYLVYPIKRQFEYGISSESYAQDLQKEVGKLAYMADWVDIAMEEADKNFRDIPTLFVNWRERVENALEEARDLLDAFDKANKTCCYGTLPDPSCRYRFSRKAMDMIEVIRALTPIGKIVKEPKDVYHNPDPGNVNWTPTQLREDGVFESRASIIEKIMHALADNGTNVVGIHGMGGVGKTTLLEDVERRIREERSFDFVLKVNVSNDPDIKMIQDNIAYALGLRMKNKQNVRTRADSLRDSLRERLQNEKGKVLIILDNLWEGLDLKSVGIPCEDDNKVIGCKLLLASRDRDVMQRDMHCDTDFHLDVLKEEEAKILFERIVGDKVHDDEFRRLMEVALSKCAGVPPLIIAMASRFKYATLSEWKDTLIKIERSKHDGFNEMINKMLQLSYDHLSEEKKSFLQLCVVCGGSKPSLEKLVRRGVDLGLFRESSSMEAARESLSSGIRTLKACSLLSEDGEADGFKIHPLVREFVISVPSRDHHFLVLNEIDKEVTEFLEAKGTY